MNLRIKNKISLKSEYVEDSYGKKSALAIASNNILIGSDGYPKAKLHIIDEPKSSNGNTLILGDTNSSNLRLGYSEEYSWVQSHGLRPLYLNELGNNTILNKEAGNVGIGTKSPRVKLEINGSLMTKNLIINQLSTNEKNEELMILLVDSKGKVFKSSIDDFLKNKLSDIYSRLDELER